MHNRTQQVLHHFAGEGVIRILPEYFDWLYNSRDFLSFDRIIFIRLVHLRCISMNVYEIKFFELHDFPINVQKLIIITKRNLLFELLYLSNVSIFLKLKCPSVLMRNAWLQFCSRSIYSENENQIYSKSLYIATKKAYLDKMDKSFLFWKYVLNILTICKRILDAYLKREINEKNLVDDSSTIIFYKKYSFSFIFPNIEINHTYFLIFPE